MPPKKRVTVMRDVAQLAGVSHQTVSRVLNEHPNVKAETRTRVLEAMKSLNYRRNLAARALVTKRSHLVGLIGFETARFGPAALLDGVEEAARAAGYLVSIATIRTREHREVVDAVHRLAQHGVDGIIAATPQPAVTSGILQARSGLPVVAIGGTHDPAADSTVRGDNVNGARLATRHLLDLGHHTVHHVAGPQDWPEAQERVAGWRDVLATAGVPIPAVEFGAWTSEWGHRRGRDLACDPAVTAIFCASDRIALGVLRALHEAGRKIPEDVSVVGCDDLPDAGNFLPPLTTVRQDFAEVGRRSFALLLERMSDQDEAASATHLVVAPELVVRASTAPPAAGRLPRLWGPGQPGS
ncbi:LacI family DNA-binding transcriptional regulator [Actinoplanes sp. NPDC051859]|uniref:LacI family DNA-binding transcriptional regulator n=1 Tax=Actinoplanes sp. NPDC051859 TaxID=3363909 RepID=UPI0037AF265F